MFLKQHVKPKNEAFTLIELLVVILIILLLLSVLIPSIAKAKEHARRVVCASNQRQIALGMSLYAENNDGWLPNFSMARGPNAHDVDRKYVEMMECDYNVKRTFFYCPSMPKRAIQGREISNNNSDDTYILGYYFWVPRYVEHYQMEIPPKITNGSLSVVDTSKYWGPKKITDPLARNNPTLTDEVWARSIVDPAAGMASFNNAIAGSSSHRWRNKLDMINQAFSDGHVERKKPLYIKARYGYKASSGDIWLYR